ncbi:hemerythrin domain-containing protein [Pontibacter sp. Tf4]|uniref:hemerythrin domain-containing protein n=1 Tax=Pontibacter sp. Tf4 TaxID=2761620 RepID=UPI001624D57E|nr:hemerythrin domain-containing protein [Pontibacter sp. Tf4]MBB6611620.1 hemerythrin domain-containing protein [Pontibacter sp. Tf4]
MNKTATPQKRDKSLVPLSREHHFGLLFCWKIRQGLKNGADLEVMRDYVRYFWKNVLKEHCDEEEWLLERILKTDDTLRARLAEEHELIHSIVKLIEVGSPMNKELFKVLERDLTDHIRWEERELFPYLQAIVDPEELAYNTDLLNHNHDPRQDNFTPEFWLTKPQAA